MTDAPKPIVPQRSCALSASSDRGIDYSGPKKRPWRISWCGGKRTRPSHIVLAGESERGPWHCPVRSCSSLSRWANSMVHDTTCLLRTAPHRTAPHRTTPQALSHCSCLPSLRPAIPPQRPCVPKLPPLFAERQTQAAPNHSESTAQASSRWQFARAFTARHSPRPRPRFGWTRH